MDDTVRQLRAAEQEVEDYLAEVEIDEMAARLRQEKLDDEMGGAMELNWEAIEICF